MGRPKKNNEEKKIEVVSLRLKPEQAQFLDVMIQRIKEATGFEITRAKVVERLMEIGRSELERQFPNRDGS